jgi:hypothetical protein
MLEVLFCVIFCVSFIRLGTLKDDCGEVKGDSNLRHGRVFSDRSEEEFRRGDLINSKVKKRKQARRLTALRLLWHICIFSRC